MSETNPGPVAVHRFDADRLKRIHVRPGPNEIVTWNDIAIAQKECYAGFQEVRKGDPVGSWTMWFDEVQYVLGGKATMVYRMPPLYAEEYRRELGEGDLFMLPLGCEFRWEVTEETPFRTIILALPFPPSMTLYDEMSVEA
ncbi:cupin domain-containing protein [Salipiger sp. P9]|uniref:cupin domain-containing protein n=1 Tax=Salipiger pentaromativorans TaxID=2943193 RepID=UPI00215750E9|nr:cupin domain-containing protein [Salipiger pentaromativorans]MCR8550529.1 cupin domain-containing protein [Salipiger pentaromativorans]